MARIGVFQHTTVSKMCNPHRAEGISLAIYAAYSAVPISQGALEELRMNFVLAILTLKCRRLEISDQQVWKRRAEPRRDL